MPAPHWDVVYMSPKGVVLTETLSPLRATVLRMGVAAKCSRSRHLDAPMQSLVRLGLLASDDWHFWATAEGTRAARTLREHVEKVVPQVGLFDDGGDDT